MASILAFDTSHQWCSVAVSKGDQIITYSSEYLPYGHSQILLPRITQALKTANLSMKDLDCVVTITGPGSFTGLRIAIATAQGISFGLSKPVLGIDVFTAYTNSIETNDNILVVIDSQKEDVYCQLWSPDHQPLKTAHAITPSQVADYAGEELYVLVGTGINKILPYLDELKKPYDILEVSPARLVQTLCFLAPEISKKGIFICEPYYIKSPLTVRPR